MTYQNNKYGGTFEEDLADRALDYIAMADDYKTHMTDRAYFMRFSIRGDARQFYNHSTSQNVTRHQMLQSFNDRYFSEDKQADISGRLAAINIKYCHSEVAEDDHAALDSLVERIIRLTPMARSKDLDEEAKIRSLIEAVRGTEYGMRATSRVTYRNSYQNLISAMNTSLCDLALFRKANDKDNPDEGHQKFMRRSLSQDDGKKETQVRDTLYAGQGRFGRNPSHID